jgi:hypothetical protein
VRIVALGDGRSLRLLTGIAGGDFATRALRSSAVLRCERRPGSTLLAVWQQNRDGYAAADGGAPRPARLGGVVTAWRRHPDHRSVLKAIYWIPASGRR